MTGAALDAGGNADDSVAEEVAMPVLCFDDIAIVGQGCQQAMARTRRKAGWLATSVTPPPFAPFRAIASRTLNPRDNACTVPDRSISAERDLAVLLFFSRAKSSSRVPVCMVLEVGTSAMFGCVSPTIHCRHRFS
jgi:hypothetical protein